MGVMHAIYGVGAMCAPLVSTQFAQLRRWSFGYFVHVGLVLINAVFQAFTFKFKSEAGAPATLSDPRSHTRMLIVNG